MAQMTGGFTTSGGFANNHPSPPSGGGLSFTTSLSSLTGNNTSSCSGLNSPSTGCRFAFTGLSDHYAQSDGSHGYSPPGPPTTPPASNTLTQTTVPAPHNTNIGSMKSLLYGGFSGKIACHFQPWWKSPSTGAHIDIGMSSDNVGFVTSQAQNMIARGCDYVVGDWYGSGSIEDQVMLLWRNYLDTCGCNLKLALMEDAGTHTGPANISNFETDINYAYNTYVVGHSSYWTITAGGGTGRPIFFSFGWTGIFGSSEWGTIKSWVHSTLNGGITGNNEPIFISEGENGCGGTNQDGCYNWVGVDSPSGHYYDNGSPGAPTIVGTSGTVQFDTHFDNTIVGGHSNDITSWYAHANSTSGTWLMAVGSAYPGFDDTNADWSKGASAPEGQGRKVSRQCGRVWVNSFAKLTAGHPVTTVGVVVWNDYEEGTAFEPGIDNCYSAPTLSLSGASLTITLHPTNVTYSSLTTVQDIKIYATIDGVNLALLDTLSPANSSTVTLTSYTGLQVGQTYQIFALQEGKPGIFNWISAPLSYTR